MWCSPSTRSGGDSSDPGAVLVYTSNAFAILGLRAMYFFLAAMIRRFEYLSVGLVFILALRGTKMLVVTSSRSPSGLAGVIVVILAVSVAASV